VREHASSPVAYFGNPSHCAYRSKFFEYFAGDTPSAFLNIVTNADKDIRQLALFPLPDPN